MFFPDKYQKQALELIENERAAWEWGVVWVSNDASFVIRDEIDTARKNYYGIFEKDKDSETGLERLWVPLTEWSVEGMVKNVDLDTKDINIKSPEAKYNPVASTLKCILFNFLGKIHFGERLNDTIRRTCIDGTGIVKVYEKYSDEFKRKMIDLRVVDPLNIIVDPTFYSLQEVPVLERVIMTRDEIDKQIGWENTKEIVYSKGSVPQAAIFERWGKIPLSLVTKKESDGNKWEEGCIISSAAPGDKETTALKDFKPAVIHKIFINKKGIKPYEEICLKKVPGRGWGRGIPEMLKGLQKWLNTVVNVKRNNALIFQTGLFKVKKGSGITRQQIEKLGAGGAIPVDNMEDIQPLRMDDLKPSVYREEIDIMSMADRVSGIFEMARGETLPSSMPATTAILQEKGSRSTFSLIQENIGLFLERLFKRHLIPSIVENLTEGEILRITGQPEDLERIDEAGINYFLNEAIAKYKKQHGHAPLFGDIQILRQKVEKHLKSFGKDRFVEIVKHIFDTEYDVEVYITDEKFDKSVMVKQLTDLLFVFGRVPGINVDVDGIMKEILDIMGISGSRFIKKVEPPAMQVQQGQAMPRETSQQGEFGRASLEGIISPREKITPRSGM